MLLWKFKKTSTWLVTISSAKLFTTKGAKLLVILLPESHLLTDAAG
jgi:hypothetical protein